jgi:hypothetical protein
MALITRAVEPGSYKAAIQERFNAHKCEPEDVSQVAARIVRKSTRKI